jgi:ribosomal protein S18 acetylase RimI-like enzyme
MGASGLDLCLSLATGADLPAMVEIQLSVYGQDTPDNRIKTTRALAEDMQENSGLRIVKAELPQGNVVGFSMFFFPNEDASTEQKKVPTPLRSGNELDEPSHSIMDRFFWIEGAEREKKALAVDRFGRQEIQRHVLGRACANVQNMCVKPEFQGQGVGGALMAWACEKFDERHINAYLEASGPGEKLYRKFGFRVIGVSENDFGDGLKVAYTHMWRDAKVRLRFVGIFH